MECHIHHPLLVQLMKNGKKYNRRASGERLFFLRRVTHKKKLLKGEEKNFRNQTTNTKMECTFFVHFPTGSTRLLPVPPELVLIDRTAVCDWVADQCDVEAVELFSWGEGGTSCPSIPTTAATTTTSYCCCLVPFVYHPAALHGQKLFAVVRSAGGKGGFGKQLLRKGRVYARHQREQRHNNREHGTTTTIVNRARESNDRAKPTKKRRTEGEIVQENELDTGKVNVVEENARFKEHLQEVVTEFRQAVREGLALEALQKVSGQHEQKKKEFR